MSMETAAAESSRTAKSYKSQLQEFVQKAGFPIPTYETVCDGRLHGPLFRSSVLVGSKLFTTNESFNHKKAAEHGAAKLALQHLTEHGLTEHKEINVEDILLCKLVLNEFLVKLKMSPATYVTSPAEGHGPSYVSSVVFDGRTYTGVAEKSKKEAEQSAARKVIQTVLERACDQKQKDLLVSIVKSKSTTPGALYENRVAKRSMITEDGAMVLPLAATTGLALPSRSGEQVVVVHQRQPNKPEVKKLKREPSEPINSHGSLTNNQEVEWALPRSSGWDGVKKGPFIQV